VRLDGKVVVITGANKGIGRKAAEALAAKGATLHCRSSCRDLGVDSVQECTKHCSVRHGSAMSGQGSRRGGSGRDDPAQRRPEHPPSCHRRVQLPTDQVASNTHNPASPFASLSKCAHGREFVDELKKMTDRVDVLIHNAGVM
jgi:NAD(P)-dependent dehydrogenase (short-subunit alcohol dehydrogenase family)